MNYNSKRWDEKRKHILRRDKYQCRLSLRYGKRRDAKVVHHIYPAKDYPEYAWCDWNLISVSNAEHEKLHNRATNELTDYGLDLMRRTKPVQVKC